MSSYFGSAYQSGQIWLQFDKIYSSRTLMDQSAETDNIYLDRLVLIKYDDSFNKPRLGFLKQKDLNNEKVVLYADSSYQTPFKFINSNEYTYGVSPNDIIYVRLNNSYHYYVCLHAQENDSDIALFKNIVNISYQDTTLNNFQLNYLLDKNTYENLPYDGYNLTVWRKAYKQDKEVYEMIANLNAETPEFILQEEAPTPEPIAPHVTPDSTNKTMRVHLQPSWGFKIKEGEEKKSDTKVKYSYSVYNPETGEIINKTEDYNGDIYYNKDGFNSDYNNLDKNAVSEVSLLPTGKSGKKYYNHKTQQMVEQPDIQELKMHFPEIGNAVASLWNIIYGNGEIDVNKKLKRNKSISWGNTDGLRMIDVDSKTGNIIYNTESVETVAGCINSVHDLMGNIIQDVSKEVNNENLLLNAVGDKIYYGKLNENDPDSFGYFYKTIDYNFIPISELDIDAESWVGTRAYQDLVNFTDKTYHTYADGNFYIETARIPKDYVSYYQLGQGKKINLITWQKNNNYYEKNNSLDYIKTIETSPIINKNYFTIQPDKIIDPSTINTLGTLKGMFWHKRYEPIDDAQTQIIEGSNNIKRTGRGYFYWDETLKTLKDLSLDLKYNKDTDYYEIEYAIAEMYNEDEQLTEVRYFIIKQNNKKVLVSSAATNLKNLIQSYKVILYVLEDNKYYYQKENKQNDYYCLHPTNGQFTIDDTIAYYLIQDTQITNQTTGDITYFYEPGMFFIKNNKGDFIIQNNNTFSTIIDYWRLTKPNGDYVLKKQDGTWDVAPTQEKFYAPGKYYYYSKKYQRDVIDQNIMMRTITDSDVDSNYIVDGKIYYLLNHLYVISDESGNLLPGSVWDKKFNPPDSVILGQRTEKNVWKELTGFASTLNTIHGLILNINHLFKFEDAYTRELETIQGCLNQIKDILNTFKSFTPQQTVFIDNYGNITGINAGDLILKTYNLNYNNVNDINNNDSIINALQKLENRIKILEERLGQ